MILLAIETATPLLGVCLWAGDGPAGSVHVVGSGRHGQMLMPMVDELFERCGLVKTDLQGVAVDRGPGLFTGLRVGLAAANAISTALGVPCAGITSLEVLAHQHRRRNGQLAAVVDARRGEVFWALYESDGSVAKPLTAPEVASPQALAAALAALDGHVLAVGDGASRYRAELEDARAEVGAPAETWPRAEALAELGVAKVRQGFGTVGGVPPLYLRQADVRIGWDEVGGRVGPGGLQEAR